MFGLGKQEKVSKGIQDTMIDILVGKYASPKECAAYCNTDEGSAWLLTEMQIQFTNNLSFMVWSVYGTNTSWATLSFFMKNVSIAVISVSGNSDMTTIIYKGLQRLHAISGEGKERISKLYDSSIALVAEHDPSISKNAVKKFMEERVTHFLNSCLQYFP